MMHRFSMRDLPKESSGYREKATDIEVQQSHSFEIKEENYGTYQPSASSGQSYQLEQQVYEDPVPVIVLRIPGPQKYAIHLQALLQQYLEIRAAQYIKALEDQERQGHLMSPQHYVAQEQHQMQYIPMVAIPPMYHHQQYYHQQLQQQQLQQQQLQQQQLQQQHQHHTQIQHEPQHEYRQVYQVQHENTYQVPAGEQSYYHQPQVHQQVEEDYPAPKQHHKQEFATSYINFVTPAYEHGEVHQPQIQHHNHHDDDALETSENYPSDKHTQVIFKKKKNRLSRPTANFHKTLSIVVPDNSSPELLQDEVFPHHQQEQVHHNHQPEHDSYSYANNHKEYRAEAEVVAVTQRSSGPINYHVMQSTLAPTREELNERHHPKRMAPFTKEQFEKARRMMMTTKTKRNRGSQRQVKVAEKPIKVSSS